MNERVAEALRALRSASAYTGDEDLVFCHPEAGHPLDASKLRKRFKDLLMETRVGKFEREKKPDGTEVERPKTRFHDLRHTFGTHCAAAGVPLRTLQEWMGHRDFSTTMIYADYASNPAELDLVERAFATPS